MGRPKKNKDLQVKEKVEVDMTKISDDSVERIKVHKEQLSELNEEIVLDSVQTEIDISLSELEKIKIEIAEHREALKKLNLREYDSKEIAISEKMLTQGSESNALKEKIARQKAYDDQMVTGRFTNRRAPGQPAKLTYIKYDTDPVKWYDFLDGMTYTIKRGFADQINEHYHTPHFIKNEAPMNADNPESGIAAVDKSNKKYMFSPVGF